MVIAIIAILAAILFPVFAKAREKARQSSCQSNLKQLGLAVTQYRNDYDERMVRQRWVAGQSYTDPDGTDGTGCFYYGALEPYIKNRQMLNCPSWSDTSANAYGYNMWLPFQTDADIANQATYGITDRVVLGDANNNYIDTETTIVDVAYVGIGYGYPNPRQVPRHNDGINYLFYDAHVKWMKPTAMNRRQWNPGWQNLSLQMSCTGATSTCPPP